MTDSEAIVARLEGDQAWLEVLDRPSGCGKCEKSGACGVGGDGQVRLQRVRNSINAKVGDTVLVSVPDGAVLKAAAWSYLVPLTLALIGALVGTSAGGDAAAIVGTALGLGIGWVVLRALDRRWSDRWEPLLALRVKPVVVRLHRNEEP
jgi:sigma-E factor negative regulatory protein RseC